MKTRNRALHNQPSSLQKRTKVGRHKQEYNKQGAPLAPLSLLQATFKRWESFSHCNLFISKIFGDAAAYSSTAAFGWVSCICVPCIYIWVLLYIAPSQLVCCYFQRRDSNTLLSALLVGFLVVLLFSAGTSPNALFCLYLSATIMRFNFWTTTSFVVQKYRVLESLNPHRKNSNACKKKGLPHNSYLHVTRKVL